VAAAAAHLQAAGHPQRGLLAGRQRAEGLVRGGGALLAAPRCAALSCTTLPTPSRMPSPPCAQTAQPGAQASPTPYNTTGGHPPPPPAPFQAPPPPPQTPTRPLPPVQARLPPVAPSGPVARVPHAGGIRHRPAQAHAGLQPGQAHQRE
jgi:hypothetical protein